MFKKHFTTKIVCNLACYSYSLSTKPLPIQGRYVFEEYLNVHQMLNLLRQMIKNINYLPCSACPLSNKPVCKVDINLEMAYFDGPHFHIFTQKFVSHLVKLSHSSWDYSLGWHKIF